MVPVVRLPIPIHSVLVIKIIVDAEVYAREMGNSNYTGECRRGFYGIYIIRGYSCVRNSLKSTVVGGSKLEDWLVITKPVGFVCRDVSTRVLVRNSTAFLIMRIRTHALSNCKHEQFPPLLQEYLACL